MTGPGRIVFNAKSLVAHGDEGPEEDEELEIPGTAEAIAQKHREAVRCGARKEEDSDE